MSIALKALLVPCRLMYVVFSLGGVSYTVNFYIFFLKTKLAKKQHKIHWEPLIVCFTVYMPLASINNNYQINLLLDMHPFFDYLVGLLFKL